MLTTYPAVLRGDHIEWAGEVPEYIKANLPLNVHVTFLDAPTRDNAISPGRRMADILEKLAALPALLRLTILSHGSGKREKNVLYRAGDRNAPRWQHHHLRGQTGKRFSAAIHCGASALGVGRELR